MLPRPVVAVVVLLLSGGVVFELVAPVFVPNVEPNPAILVPLLTAIGAVLAGKQGPKPDGAETAPPPPPAEPSVGRHRDPRDRP